MKPRFLRPGSFEQPVLVYTDGAFETGVGTWGAVVVDRAGKSNFVHHGQVPRAVLDCWHDRVGDVEMYAFLILRYHYKEYFFCIDLLSHG